MVSSDIFMIWVKYLLSIVWGDLGLSILSDALLERAAFPLSRTSKILKIYKKSISKSEKMWNSFRKKWRFPEIFEISRKFEYFNWKSYWKSSKFWKIRKFREIFIFPENFSHFFTFWNGFFTDFQSFWCSGKRKCCSFE